MQKPSLEMYPSRLYAERMIGAGPPLASAVVQIIERIAEITGNLLCWQVGDDHAKPTRITPDRATIEDLLAHSSGPRDPFVPMVLADHPSEWRFVFSAGAGLPGQIDVDVVDLSLPGARRPQLADLATMMRLVEEVARAHGAHTAYVEDAALLALYVAKRSHEKMLAKLPPWLRDQGQPPPQPVPGVAGTLPDLLVAGDYDRRRIPQGVYWINWWDAQQVAALGRARVESAGWERAIFDEEGNATLAATPAPPDLTRPEDLDQLRRILEHIDLRGAQERG